MSDNSPTNDFIRILGAQQHNLKNIDVEVPINRLTVITGVSGSGKSSLAFDTLYAEGQRRYVESLSAYARQFLDRIRKPQVREIEGISPSIAIRQRTVSRNPRSTVGTVTEIYDHLRLLYSRIGIIRCRECGREVKKDTLDVVLDEIRKLPETTRIYLSFPLAESRLDLASRAEVALPQTIDHLVKEGFRRLLLVEDSTPVIRQLPQEAPPSIEELMASRVLVDRLVLGPDIEERLTDSLEACYRDGNGTLDVTILPSDKDEERAARTQRFTLRFECQDCSIAYRAPEPRLFSFNSPYGACPTCHGFGSTTTIDPDLVIPDPSKTLAEGPIDPFTKPRYRRFQEKLIDYAQGQGIPMDLPFEELPEGVRRKLWEGEGSFPGVLGFFRYLDRKKYKMYVRIFISRYRGYTRCPECEGERLCAEARTVYVGQQRIHQLTSGTIKQIYSFFSELGLNPTQFSVAKTLLREITQRLDFLIKVGLQYLTLDRLTSSLSGGEMQRIQLAASLGSSLVGTLYVLDEPSIGLHPRDERRLIGILKDLRDLGNTIVVVEHEREMIESADHVIDMGPGPGEHGGEVVCSGDVGSISADPNSLTGRYLKGTLRIPTPVFRRATDGRFLTIRGARQNNLKNLDIRLPLGILVCVSGVSGSGKSTLVQEILYAGLKKLKRDWKAEVGEFDAIEGGDQIGEVFLVDQSPIGKTPRSNPVTYLKAFDDIRQIFASLRRSKSQNLTPGHFSFNVHGGRCEACQGAGSLVVDMQFLADVELLCEECKGKRFKSSILEIVYKGKNIAEVLELTAVEAIEFFKSHPRLIRRLKVLDEVGLGYLRLGQASTTLSGGEAQRIKLASYLSKPTSNRPLFIFDEPTTGLHFDDIGKLLRAFDRLIAQEATVLVIEHNLDVIKCADWVIDLGPEGGDRGGKLVAEGTPETICQSKKSYTGKFLRGVLGNDSSERLNV